MGSGMAGPHELARRARHARDPAAGPLSRIVGQAHALAPKAGRFPRKVSVAADLQGPPTFLTSFVRFTLCLVFASPSGTAKLSALVPILPCTPIFANAALIEFPLKVSF